MRKEQRKQSTSMLTVELIQSHTSLVLSIKTCHFKNSPSIAKAVYHWLTYQQTHTTTLREPDSRAFLSRQGSLINLAFILSMKFQVCHMTFPPIFLLPKHTVPSGRRQDRSISKADILLKSISVIPEWITWMLNAPVPRSDLEILLSQAVGH